MAKGVARIVKVKIKDIKPNPYREFNIYPYRQEKIYQLFKSFRKTGSLWPNIVGRLRKGGKVEIAYGHHRIEMLRRWRGEETEVEVIVKDLSNKQMLDMMSNENAEAYNCPIEAIDNSVMSAKKYLESHKGEAKEILTSGGPGVKRLRIGAPVIAKYLKEKTDRVEKALERLYAIEAGLVDQEAVYTFPSSQSADNFISVVKNRAIEKKYQLRLAKDIVKQKRLGEKDMKLAVERLGLKEVKARRCRESEDLRLLDVSSKLNKYMKEGMKKLRPVSTDLNLMLTFLDSMTLRGKSINELVPDETINDYVQSLGTTKSWIKLVEDIIKKKTKPKAMNR